MNTLKRILSIFILIIISPFLVLYLIFHNKLQEVSFEFDNYKNKILVKLENEINIYWFLLLTVTFFTITLTYLLFGYDKDFIKNVLVELHGLIFDILILGLIFLLFKSYSKKTIRKREIIKELELLQNLNSEYSTYKTVLLIAEYKNSRIKDKLHLRNIKFINSDLSSINLSNLVLVECAFINCSLKSANFKESVFDGCSFSKTDLTNSNFENCRIENTVFEACNFVLSSISDTFSLPYNKVTCCCFGNMDFNTINNTNYKCKTYEKLISFIDKYKDVIELVSIDRHNQTLQIKEKALYDIASGQGVIHIVFPFSEKISEHFNIAPLESEVIFRQSLSKLFYVSVANFYSKLKAHENNTAANKNIATSGPEH